jgi:FMNH2-dependent dimethyl sulfone monooxygenase
MLKPQGHQRSRHADFGFQIYPDLDKLTEMNRELRRRAAEHGRGIGSLGTAYVVCADTEAEARRYHEHYVDQLGDYAAAENLIGQLVGGQANSWPAEAYRAMVRGVVGGWGGFPLIGTPEQIVEKLTELKQAGTDGLALSWVDYETGIAQFNEQVLPLLVEAGLRRA